MINNVSETSGLENDKEFKAWCESLENSNLTDKEISLAIRDKVLESPQLDKQSKAIFKDTYNYILKILEQNKPFEIKLLRIYLEDICGYKLEKYSIISTLLLCSMCGLSIEI